jgi:hypothetical protein
VRQSPTGQMAARQCTSNANADWNSYPCSSDLRHSMSVKCPCLYVKVYCHAYFAYNNILAMASLFWLCLPNSSETSFATCLCWLDACPATQANRKDTPHRSWPSLVHRFINTVSHFTEAARWPDCPVREQVGEVLASEFPFETAALVMPRSTENRAVVLALLAGSQKARGGIRVGTDAAMDRCVHAV